MIVDSARTAAELLEPIVAGREGEGVAVLHLDSARRLLGSAFAEAVEADLPVRDVVAAALRLGSAGLIVASSHSGGDAGPSVADLASARELAAAAAAVGVRLIDHLVFAGGECRSLRELKLL